MATRSRRGNRCCCHRTRCTAAPTPFPIPEQFDPDRFTPEREKALPRYAYLPFGAGSRVCIGSHFALMEGQLALATLAQRVTFALVGEQHPASRAHRHPAPKSRHLRHDVTPVYGGYGPARADRRRLNRHPPPLLPDAARHHTARTVVVSV